MIVFKEINKKFVRMQLLPDESKAAVFFGIQN